MDVLIVAIMLVIPSPFTMVDWTVNEVPTQIQVIHKSCDFKPRHKREMIFRSPMDRCYSVFDLSSPRFVRHPDYWYKIELPKPPLVNSGE
jgi:hypothetical protein